MIEHQKENIENLRGVVESVFSPEEAQNLQKVIENAVKALLDGDFHSCDELLHSVGRAVNERVNRK